MAYNPAPKETCEDRGYKCCELMPPPVQSTWPGYLDWYDRHVTHYYEAIAMKAASDEFLGLSWPQQLRFYVNWAESLLCTEYHGATWPDCEDENHLKGRILLNRIDTSEG